MAAQIVIGLTLDWASVPSEAAPLSVSVTEGALFLSDTCGHDARLLLDGPQRFSVRANPNILIGI